MRAKSFSTDFRVGGDHAALPGHFPQRPVVPGVVLLDRVAAAMQSWRGQGVHALLQVKFMRPLLPDQDAVLHLDENGKNIRFDIFHDAELIASGILQPAATATDDPA